LHQPWVSVWVCGDDHCALKPEPLRTPTRICPGAFMCTVSSVPAFPPSLFCPPACVLTAARGSPPGAGLGFGLHLLYAHVLSRHQPRHHRPA
jgi:hypothetical protein